MLAHAGRTTAILLPHTGQLCLAQHLGADGKFKVRDCLSLPSLGRSTWHLEVCDPPKGTPQKHGGAL